jgi:hypothetical protein
MEAFFSLRNHWMGSQVDMRALFPYCNERQKIQFFTKVNSYETERTNSSHTQTDARGFHRCFRFFLCQVAAPFSLPYAQNHFTVSQPSWPPMCWPHASPLVVTAVKIHTHKKKRFSLGKQCEKTRSSNHMCSDALQMKLVHGRRSTLSTWRSIQNPQASAE